MRSVVPPDRTVTFVMLQGGWRILVSSIIVTGPLYGWILFYYLSTGAWHQSPDIVRAGAPPLATFILPLVIGGWILGFRRWYLVCSIILTVIIAACLPSPTLAIQLLPKGYINLAIVLILLMIYLQSFRYWRESIVLELPVARYTTGACVMIVMTTAALLTLLSAITY